MNTMKYFITIVVILIVIYLISTCKERCCGGKDGFSVCNWNGYQPGEDTESPARGECFRACTGCGCPPEEAGLGVVMNPFVYSNSGAPYTNHEERTPEAGYEQLSNNDSSTFGDAKQQQYELSTYGSKMPSIPGPSMPLNYPLPAFARSSLHGSTAGFAGRPLHGSVAGFAGRPPAQDRMGPADAPFYNTADADVMGIENAQTDANNHCSRNIDLTQTRTAGALANELLYDAVLGRFTPSQKYTQTNYPIQLSALHGSESTNMSQEPDHNLLST